MDLRKESTMLLPACAQANDYIPNLILTLTDKRSYWPLSKKPHLTASRYDRKQYLDTNAEVKGS